MPEDRNGRHLKLWIPATYRIEVVGALDESWSDRLGGMLIKARKRADQSTVTTLTGRLRDQAELTGVINSLYELHLPILSIQYLSADNSEGRPDPDSSSPCDLKGVKNVR